MVFGGAKVAFCLDLYKLKDLTELRGCLRKVAYFVSFTFGTFDFGLFCEVDGLSTVFSDLFGGGGGAFAFLDGVIL